MKKILAAAAVAIALVAGGAYLALQNRVGGEVEKGVANFFNSLPPEYTKRAYGKVSVDLPTKTLVIENIDLEHNVGPRKLKVARLEVIDPDIDGFTKIFDPRAYASGQIDATMRRLAGRMTLSGVQIDEPNSTTNVTQMVYQGVHGRQFPAAPTAEWRAGLKDGQLGAILLQTFKLDAAEVNDVSGTGGPSTATIAIQKITATAVNAENLGMVGIAGLKFAEPGKNDSVELGLFEIADLQWAKLLDALAKGQPPADFGAAMALYRLGRLEVGQVKIVNDKEKSTIGIDKLAIGNLDEQGLGSASFGGLTVADAMNKVDVSVGEFDMRGLRFGGLIGAMGKGGRELIDAMAKDRAWVDSISIRKIGGPTLAALGIGLNEIALTAKREGDNVETSKFVIAGLEIDGAKSKSPELGEVFKALNYQRTVFDLAVSGKSDRQRKTLDVDQFSFGAPQVGRIDLVFGFDNYEQQNDPAKSIEAMLAAQLRALKLAYRDEGLAERLLSVAAKQQGMTVDQLREMIDGQIKAMTEAFDQSPPIVAGAEALRAFVKQPKTLTLNSKPAEPVPLAQLAAGQDDPQALVDLLKLTLVYE